MIDMDAIMPTRIRPRVRTRPPWTPVGAKSPVVLDGGGGVVTVRDRLPGAPYDIFRTIRFISPDGVTQRGDGRSSRRRTGLCRLPTEHG
ncbi:hypothetical protein [Streptomyces sp. NBC_00316]|uniref:hypothetical protein n=1 Tax=Streptomyces sp. NBC_00316 TaxID=2975710 RepID=UPI002E2C4DAD|nr:hypothetical protein [Streptomyces sp. NBC_00316]